MIGREDDVAAVVRLLRDRDVRLATLTGSGGVGKTRLAIEVADQAKRAFADGATLVSLAPVADADLVPSAVAASLGIRHQDGRSPADRVLAALSSRELLLVLDNFEHVAEAAHFVGDAVTMCPGVRVLATSRAPLHLSGEHEYEVQPLALPHSSRTPGGREIVRYAAVALFVERARAADRTFALNEANASAVAEICTRLDGVPLALELAAARVKLLPPEAMLERLAEHPLSVLTGGPRDLPDRQRSLRGTVEWSYGLLGDAEQRLLARLSVFRGGATLAAAEAVGSAGERERPDVLAGLGTLLGLSLVTRTAGPCGDVRIRMLETIREFALERLDAGGDGRIVRHAHAETMRALAEGAELKLRTREQEAWLDRLEADHDNLRAALRFSLESGKSERAMRLAGALARFWLIHGYLAEGREWLDSSLASGHDAPGPVRAKAMVGAGVLTHYQNDYNRAARLFESAIELYRRTGDRRGIATSLNGLAMVVGRHRDPSAAREMYREALAIARELGDGQEVAFLLERLGTVLWYTGETGAARPLLEESLDEARRLELPHETANAIQALGWLSLSERRPAQARRLLEDALVQLRDLGDRWGVVRATFGLGFAATERGTHAAARERFGEALRLVRSLDDKLVTCGCLVGLAVAAVAGERSARAVTMLAAAERLRSELGASHSTYVRAAHERALSAARASIGGEAFHAAWARGAGLTIDEAVSLAEEEAAQRTRAAGPDGLTSREMEVLRLVARGATDPAVAEQLVLSVRTVHAHMRSIYRKAGVGSRSEATRYALERELV